MKMLLLINGEASSSTLVENLATNDKKKPNKICNENIKIKETKEMEKIERQKLN
jgi:hypothetical protein